MLSTEPERRSAGRRKGGFHGAEALGLTLTCQGAVGRPLLHMGGRVFHPAGAADVRVVFAGEPPSMTITDGALTIAARRD